MAGEKMTELPIESVGIGENDLMLISKEIAPTVYESQKINPNNIFYDSGFKNIPIFSGVYGVADIGQGVPFTTLTIRIINRTVFIGGTYILPLSTVPGGGVLANDWSNYNTAPLNTVPYIYKGDGGFQVTTNGELVQQDPMLPAVLHPETTTILLENAIALRPINITNPKRFPMQSFISKAYLLTDGRFGVSPVVSTEGNGNQAFSITSPLSELCSIYNAGDILPDYTNYRSGFDGALNKRLDIVPQTPANIDSPLTIDAREGGDLGGFYLNINSQYHLDKSTPIDLIIAAFDAL